jgi:two-component system CheB/CheR fusion protein
MSERLHVLIVEDNPADADLMRDSHDAITVQDMDGRIIAWNPGAVRMYGWRTQRIAKDGRSVEVWLTATALVNETGQMYAVATTERMMEEGQGHDQEKV